VQLIPAQFVKPYRKSNKNDFIDAEAIAEAVTKQNMRFVQIKTQEQLDWQAMHRVRDRLMQRRTALINEIRGFLLERGLTFAARPIYLRKNLPTMIGDAEQNLSPRLRWLLNRLWQEFPRRRFLAAPHQRHRCADSTPDWPLAQGAPPQLNNYRCCTRSRRP
jgi:transposase